MSEKLNKLDSYIKDNIHRYTICPLGYATNLKMLDLEQEVRLLNELNDDVLGDSIAIHQDSHEFTLAAIDASYDGNWKDIMTLIAKHRIGFDNCISRYFDELADEGLLLQWLKDYAESYAEDQAVEAEMNDYRLQGEM